MLFRLRKSERSRIEAFAGLLLAIITLAFPMTWWLKIALVFVLAGISVHLIFSSPATIRLQARSKIWMSLVAVTIIVVSVAWNRIQEHYLNDRIGNADQPKQPATKEIVQALKKIPGLISGAKTDERLKSDAASLAKQLREFQQKVDDWNRTAASRLNQDAKNEKSDDEAHKLFIERAKEVSASMANLDKQFNNDLKPRVIAIKNQLLSRLTPKSVPAKPTVDWTLKYGFSTFPNAVGDIADYLESLAAMLPGK